ncbi:hypothetical protein ACEWY4_009380 [Coilia grayii]|uniref:NEDD4-binding protein 2-like 1 n=1 Tax=Coilia grayii TaxID=363190 RepID=A0ABD1K694_9TELE
MGRKKHPHRTKTLYILRGLPGTGKSDRAWELQQRFGGEIISADDYWPRNKVGHYRVIPGELHKAHMWARNEGLKAMDREVDPVIIDNTNMTHWDMYPYVLMAFNRGYWIKFKVMKDTWHVSLEDLYSINKKRIPFSTLERMKSKYQPVRHIYDILRDDDIAEEWKSRREMKDSSW